MVWDNLSCLGTEALARLGWRLGGFQLMLQSSLSDGVAFDPFSFQKDVSGSLRPGYWTKWTTHCLPPEIG
jgi:hypothetical protein